MSAEGWLPGSLRQLGDAIVASPIPMLVCDLADQRLLLVNRAVAELFGVAPAAMVGRPASQVWSGTRAAQAKDALSALMTGAVDSYRAQRQVPGPGGPLDVWVWARTLKIKDRSFGVSVVVPAGEPSFAGHLIGTYFGPDAIDLAVGTLDAEGRLCEITPNSEEVLGVGRDKIAGSELANLVHPDDVDRLMSAVRAAAESSEETAINVRLRHPERGWAEVRCFALSTSKGQPPRLALALAESAGDMESEPASHQFADLERQVLRIAAELHAVTLTQRGPQSAHESRYAILDTLPPRQREIVDRLLEGERIPTIAASMYLSPSTIRNHLSKAFRAFGVGSQAELLSLLRSELIGETDS
jgi:DNA-binding NarL/FixJ family response regulator